MEQVPLRNVALKEIYESYMGILRISPNLDGGAEVDDPTMFLGNPKDGSNDRRIILTDSDGVKLGVDFIPRVRATEVVTDAKGTKATQNVINMTMDTDGLFAVESYNVRSTLFVNEKNQTDKVMPIQIYSNDGTVTNVVTLPLESPHNDSYFNNKNKLGLINYNDKSKTIYEQISEALYNQSRSWYDTNANAFETVKINNKTIYAQNKDQESIPIVHTHDYALGTYKGHTAKVTPNIIANYLGSSPEAPQERQSDYTRLLNANSTYTRLDFVQLDKIVWTYLNQILAGEVRDDSGRYNELGINQHGDLKAELFGNANFDTTKKAPLLGGGVAAGTISYHAMPFHRYAFHILRQELANKKDEGKVTGNLGTWSDNEHNYITPINKKQDGFVNNLTKEYILCDGKEITYANYPYMNTENPNLFSVSNNGITDRNNGVPVAKYSWEGDTGSAYNAIKQSNADKNGKTNKLKTPNLLAADINAMRYIRGLNWKEQNNLGLNSAIVSDTANPNYVANNTKYEIVKNSTWGQSSKNIWSVGNYRTGIDFRLRKSKHCHLLFYKSNSNNRQAIGNNITDGSTFGSGIAGWTISKNTSFNYGDTEAYRPFFWDSDTDGSTPSYKTNSAPNTTTDKSKQAMSVVHDGIAQIRYSFSKRQTYTSNGKTLHRPNHFDGCTPVPAGALIAWKRTGTNESLTGETITQNDLANGLYMNDANETQISTNATTRNSQLYLMNLAEGYAPIAHQGGTDKAKTFARVVTCKRDDKGSLKEDMGRYRNTFTANTGGYNMKKWTESIKSDIPRCVTSLPTPYTLEEVKENDGEAMTNNISQPPSINLIPLFKI